MSNCRRRVRRARTASIPSFSVFARSSTERCCRGLRIEKARAAMTESRTTPSLAKRRYATLAVLSPLALLAIWTLLTVRGAVPPVILPSPLAVAASLWDMIVNGYSGISIGTHVAASMTRVGIAFTLGSLLGITLGLLRGRAQAIDALFVVPSAILLPIPPLGL